MATSGIYTRYYKVVNPGGSSKVNSAIVAVDNAADAAFSLSFEWETTSQDVIANTSTVDWLVRLTALDYTKIAEGTIAYDNPASYLRFGTDRTLSTPPYDTYKDIEVSLAGQDLVILDDFVRDLYADQNLIAASGTTVVTHAVDGILNPQFTVRVRFCNAFDAEGDPCYRYYNEEDFGAGSIASISGNLPLEAIPRNARITDYVTSFRDIDSPTIICAVPPVASNTVAYIAFDGTTPATTVTPITETGFIDFTFVFSDSDKRVLWSILDQGLLTKQVKFVVRCTVDGVTYYDTKNTTLQIVNYMPTLNPEVWDSNAKTLALTGNKYKLIKYASNASFSTGAQAKKHATIDTQGCTNAGIPKNGPTGVFESVTDNVFYFTVTDSFGRSVQSTYELSKAEGYFIDYIKLTCSASTTDMTADGDVRVTLTGQYFKGSFGATSNALTVSYKLTKNSLDPETVNLGAVTPTMSGTEYTYSFLISGLDYTSVYKLEVTATDKVMPQPATANLILASTPIFDWGRTDFNFNVPVNVEGDLTVSGNITAGGKTIPTIQAQGTAGIWTYRTWSDGTAECWGKKDFTVNVTSQWGSMYTSGAISGSNISFPFGLFAETPVVNASLLVRSAGGILMAPGGAGSSIATMDQTGVYEIARGTSLSNAQYTINYQVIGKWK